jgi:hypothetical protein
MTFKRKSLSQNRLSCEILIQAVCLEPVGGPRLLSQETLLPSPKSQAASKAAGPRVTIVKGERRNEAARRKVADVPVHDGLPGSLVSRLSARRVNQVHCVQSLSA